MSLTGLTDHLDGPQPSRSPQEPPRKPSGGGGVFFFFFLAALAFAGWRNRALLGRVFVRLVAPNLKIAAREARESGGQLLQDAGVLKPAPEALPEQPPAVSLAAPRPVREGSAPEASAQPEDNVRKDQRPHKPGEGRMPWEQFTRSEVAQAQNRLYRKQAGVEKTGSGAEFITQHIDAPWILTDDRVPFWDTPLGRGVRYFAYFSLFFLGLGTLLFRTNKRHYKTF